MCGIYGFYSKGKTKWSRQQFDSMGEAIKHRGPDHTGAFFADHVAIGNQRLSIIDVEGGNQPFFSEDGEIVLVQNGEIYNHVELAEELAADGVRTKTLSDTEVLLLLYQKHGIAFLSKLNGMFCIAIYDEAKDELLLARDRVGIKPLFIHEHAGNVLFGSEIKAILAAGVPPTLNKEALQMFLAYNYVPPPHTMFAGVTHLSPGHYMRISKDGVQTKQWWDLPSLAKEIQYTEIELVENITELLDDAVRLRMRADVPFGAFLSGGVDSGTVVGLMSRHTRSPVKTFCIGFDEKKFDESVCAEQVASMHGCDHHCENVSSDMMDLWPMTTYHCDQPHGDVSFLPTYMVSRLAANDVKMVLTGDGGDELFAGYDKYKDYFTENNSSISHGEFSDTYCRNISLFCDEDRKRLMHDSQQVVADDIIWQPVVNVLNSSSHMGRVNQALLVDMLLLLPGNNLVKPDRMGMAVSLEARTPFLDYRLVELAFTIPDKMKLHNGITKYILKKVASPIIGEDLAYRKKQMFTVPVGEWFKGDMYEDVKSLLTSGRASTRELFDLQFVATLLKDHRSESKNNTREIRALIAVELWHQAFID